MILRRHRQPRPLLVSSAVPLCPDNFLFLDSRGFQIGTQRVPLDKTRPASPICLELFGRAQRALATFVPEGRNRASGLFAKYPASSILFFCMVALLVSCLKLFEEALLEWTDRLVR